MKVLSVKPFCVAATLSECRCVSCGRTFFSPRLLRRRGKDTFLKCDECWSGGKAPFQAVSGVSHRH